MPKHVQAKPVHVRAMHVKKGDTVIVLSGKDKGVKGKIIASFPEKQRVIVEGVNRITKHTKVGSTNRGAQTGGIITQEAPIHVSNVMLIDSETDKPTRVGFRRDTVEKRRPDGTTYQGTRSVRIAKRSGKDV
jgi:large subunit ribosomal protein L24